MDGKEVRANEGSTILEVARSCGIDIPTLCYHEDLSPYGACRMCMVEVVESGRNKLVAACLYPVRSGMQVATKSERITRGRRMILELLLSRCPNSEKLKQMAADLGLERMRFLPKDDDCILCGLCVAMCRQIMKNEEVGFVGRGRTREAVTPFRASSDFCLNCGACRNICPARGSAAVSEQDRARA